MMNNQMMMWQTAIYQFAGLLVLAACALLWMRSKTFWVSLALGAQAVFIVSGYLPFLGGLHRQYPMVTFVYPVAAALFAIGLAGHAWAEYETFKQRARQGKQA